MKRQMILPLILLLLYMSGCVSQKPDAWEDAYAAFVGERTFLEDLTPLSGEHTIWSYSMRDLDNSGVPELIIFQSDSRDASHAVLTAYSYDEEIHKIGEYENEKGSFISWFRVSDDPTLPGLFEMWHSGGEEHYGYLSIEDGELVYEYLWHNDRTVTPPQETTISDNQQLVDESIKLNPPYDSDDTLLEVQFVPVDR